MSTKSIELERRGDGVFVAGELHNALKPSDLLVAERTWSPFRSSLMADLSRAGVPRREWPQSLHWSWEQKAPELARLDATGFGIFLDGKWQGLMLTKTVLWLARLPEDRGKPVLYVDFLEAAPWNWNVGRLNKRGEYKGVGSVLFREAVLLSIDEEFRGRVGLHALPQADEFYQRCCGMVDLGPDPAKSNLHYFELSQAAAERYLNE